VTNGTGPFRYDDCASETGTLAEHIRDVVAQPITLGTRQLHVDASIGVVMVWPDDPRSGEDLLRDVDVAMYLRPVLGRPQLRRRAGTASLRRERDDRAQPRRGKTGFRFRWGNPAHAASDNVLHAECPLASDEGMI
jgi:hypothetical protein